MDRTTARWPAGAALAALLWAQPGAAEADAAPAMLRIGLVAHPAAGAAIEGAALIEQAFAEATGLPTRIFVARDYAALIDAQAGGRIDYGVYSAAAYATARLACGCVEPIAAPIGTDGATGLRAVLIERRDRSGTPGAIATVPGDVTHWLAAARPARGADGERYLAAATASQAEALFLSGEASGIVGWMPSRPGSTREGGTLSRLVEAGVAAAELEIVWQSEPLRFGPHAVRADMPDAVRSALILFLAGLRDARPEVFQHLEPLRQGGFVRVSDADYATARAMVARIAEPGPSR
jgi:phosphonate transport system substrate-binding protein